MSGAHSTRINDPNGNARVVTIATSSSATASSPQLVESHNPTDRSADLESLMAGEMKKKENNSESNAWESSREAVSHLSRECKSESPKETQQDVAAATSSSSEGHLSASAVKKELTDMRQRQVEALRGQGGVSGSKPPERKVSFVNEDLRRESVNLMNGIAVRAVDSDGNSIRKANTQANNKLSSTMDSLDVTIEATKVEEDGDDDDDDDDDDEDVCFICMEGFTSFNPRWTLECICQKDIANPISVHGRCIRKWKLCGNNALCPLCRQPLPATKQLSYQLPRSQDAAPLRRRLSHVYRRPDFNVDTWEVPTLVCEWMLNNPVPPEQASTEEIIDLLAQLELSHYVDVFFEEELDGGALRNLNEDDLKDLGVTEGRDMARFECMLQVLKGRLTVDYHFPEVLTTAV